MPKGLVGHIPAVGQQNFVCAPMGSDCAASEAESASTRPDRPVTDLQFQLRREAWNSHPETLLCPRRGGETPPSVRKETSERTAALTGPGADERRSRSTIARCRRAEALHRSPVRADVPEPFSRTLRERARRYATTPQHSATTEADPFSFLRSSRRDARAACRQPHARRSGSGYPPSSIATRTPGRRGLEMFGEATYGVEDGPPHEEIRSAAKPPPRSDVGERTGRRQQYRRATERPRVSSGFDLPLAVRR